MGLTYPQHGSAQDFTGAEFATWSEESQNGFMQTSVTMAGIVFTQTHPGHASCIDAQYFADGAWDTSRGQLRNTILDHQDAHPGGVILAVILRDCGALD
ncbi:MAG: hypothetical protein Gyms2KO_33080 [Gymnodinialimonas sp.]